MIEPQVEARIKRRDELFSLISLKQNSEFKKISSERMEEAQTLLTNTIEELEAAVSSHKLSQSTILEQVESIQVSLNELETETIAINQKLARLEGHIGAELFEANETLRLIYEGSDKSFRVAN